MTSSSRFSNVRYHVRTATQKNLQLWSMMMLTFVTGMLDSVGYLGLDRIFTGNMTGNVVILGMGLAGADGLPVAGPVIALGGYLIGAAVVGRLLRGRPKAWNATITTLLTVSTLMLAAAATTLLTHDVRGGTAAGIAIAAVIAMLMGGQAAIARFLAIADMTTVVVTSTITAYASETLFAPGIAWLTHRRLWAIAMIFLGALAGAVLLTIDVSIPVYVAAVATAGVTVIGHRVWEDVAH